MAAEGLPALRDGVAPSRFNGAATGWPRKDASVRTVRPTWTCFNGAATGWPRKAVCDPCSLCGRMALQWGRDRMAAEGGGRGDEAKLKGALQWGRDRMAAEGA